ncbi:MAG: hypothetical protein KDJ65_13100 [Anaerolineae bacterium]|nr:hypothetical protein [Anaerolineae bacterium]
MPKLTVWIKQWLILLSYAALAIGLTHPMFWNITRGAYGQEGKDVLHYVWQLWWAKQALLTLQQLPSHVTSMGWPEGIYHPLLFVNPYIDMLGLPITLISSSSTTYNFHVLLSFTLSGFTAYLLSYNLTRNRAAGFVAGLIFAFTAHRWAHAFTGHLYHITIYWGPLFAWALWRFVRTPNRKWGLWLGMSASFLALTHVMHTAYFLLPVTLVLFIWGWRTYSPTQPNWWPAVIKSGLWSLLPFVLVVGPFYSYFFVTLGQTEGDLEAGGIVGNSTDLLAYLTPSWTNPILSTYHLIPTAVAPYLPPVDLDENVTYIGLAALVLAAIGYFTISKTNRRPWFWLILVTGILALGPFLKFGGDVLTYTIGESQSYILMPYAVLAKIPPLSWGRTTGRLTQTLMLGISVLSAYGVAYLLTWRPSRSTIKAVPGASPPSPPKGGIRSLSPSGGSGGLNATLLTVAVVGLAAWFIAESLVMFPFTRATPTLSPYYAQLQADSTVPTGGMLDLPLRNKEEVNLAMYNQTFHRQPIVGGYIHRRFKKVEWGEHFADLLFRPATAVPAFASPTDADRLATLNALGLSRVAFHKDMADNTLDAEQAAFLDQLLGPASYNDALLSFYPIPPTEPRPNPIVFARASNWTHDGLFPESNSPRHVYVYVPQPTYLSWTLTVTPMSGPTVMSLDAEILPRDQVMVTRPGQYTTLTRPVEPGIYRYNFVNDEICQGDSGCAPLRFDQVQLNESSHPEPPLAVWSDNTIELTRYTVAADPATGQLLLVLDWLPRTPTDVEPTLFVHILDAAGNRIQQVDRRLLDGKYPPAIWTPEVVIRDIVPLPVHFDEPWQNYTLRLGLYNAADGSRFSISEPLTPDHSLDLPFNLSTELSYTPEP